MDNGWIKLHRSLLKWEWHDDPNTFCLWVHLLLMANHDEQKWHGMVIPRGSLLTGRKKLAEETGLTEQSVRTSLIKLEKSQNLTNKSTNKFTLITICNYDTYQDTLTNYQPTNQPTTNQQLTNNQPTTNQQLTTNKNIKNVRIEERKEDNIISLTNARARENGEGCLMYSVDDLLQEILSECDGGSMGMMSMCRLYGLQLSQVKEAASIFADKLIADGTTMKARGDFRHHFNSWLKLNVKQLFFSNNNGNTIPGTNISAEYVARQLEILGR